VDCAVFAVNGKTSKNNLQKKDQNTVLNSSPMAALGVQHMCAKFPEFHYIYTLTFMVSRKPHFRNHGMENVLAEHSNNETIQASRYWCLMTTNIKPKNLYKN